MEKVGPYSLTSFQVGYGDVAFDRWQNGNPSLGLEGSVPGVEAWSHSIAEIVHVIEHSGIEPNRDDLQQLRKAIAAMIAAATGGGDTSEYLLLSQARARLPIYPEILSADGRMNVSSPAAGTILVPSAVAFQHRGIFPLSTSDYSESARTFATASSKTYHLRWSPSGGFRLLDLLDEAYNPLARPELDPMFDTDFDNMLLARVITSASNVATITNLINKDRLFFQKKTTGAPASGPSGSFNLFLSENLLWSRTPKVASIVGNIGANNPSPAGGMDGYASFMSGSHVDRYVASGTVVTDWTSGNANSGLQGYIDFNLAA